VNSVKLVLLKILHKTMNPPSGAAPTGEKPNNLCIITIFLEFYPALIKTLKHPTPGHTSDTRSHLTTAIRLIVLLLANNVFKGLDYCVLITA
jgi:hypothetical protein